jgi:hypothetical protein
MDLLCLALMFIDAARCLSTDRQDKHCAIVHYCRDPFRGGTVDQNPFPTCLPDDFTKSSCFFVLAISNSLARVNADSLLARENLVLQKQLTSQRAAKTIANPSAIIHQS